MEENMRYVKMGGPHYEVLRSLSYIWYLARFRIQENMCYVKMGSSYNEVLRSLSYM